MFWVGGSCNFPILCAHFLCLCPQYWKSRKTGSGYAADSKLRYTIQFSILMLCAKYQEAGLCGSREKYDRNYLVSKFAYVHNIQRHVKQEIDKPQIQKCVTRYSCPYWCSVPNIRKLVCAIPEINVTEIFCDADDDNNRSDPFMSPPLKRAGDTKIIHAIKMVSKIYFHGKQLV